jgi:5-methylcytosine-specific restriction endonuclease McrA
MPAYLFLWNPKKDPASFTHFERVRTEAATGTPYQTRWICPSRQPRKGDVAFVQRTGERHNGVFARGVVVRAPYDHQGVQVVRLSLDSFLPLGGELARSVIVAKAEYEKPWMPMASGNVIPEPILEAIQALWPEPVGRSESTQQPEVDALAEELVGIEGEALRRLVVHRKRERDLRERRINDALRKDGRLVCQVPGCGFDFSRVYGELGVGYAQVHHLHPLGRSTEPRETSLTDLAIVCANCHAMIHRGGDCRNLSALIPGHRKR